jgi:hypothetical protein
MSGNPVLTMYTCCSSALIQVTITMQHRAGDCKTDEHSRLCHCQQESNFPCSCQKHCTCRIAAGMSSRQQAHTSPKHCTGTYAAGMSSRQQAHTSPKHCTGTYATGMSSRQQAPTSAGWCMRWALQACQGIHWGLRRGWCYIQPRQQRRRLRGSSLRGGGAHI